MKRAYNVRAYPTRPQEARAAQLKAIRAADPGGQGRHSFTAQQQTLPRLNATFAAYLKRARGAKGRARRVGHPRFKAYQRLDQVLFVAGDGARVGTGGRWAYASFQAVGRVKVGQHRPILGRVKTLQLKREHAAGMSSSSPISSRCCCRQRVGRSGSTWAWRGS